MTGPISVCITPFQRDLDPRWVLDLGKAMHRWQFRGEMMFSYSPADRGAVEVSWVPDDEFHHRVTKRGRPAALAFCETYKETWKGSIIVVSVSARANRARHLSVLSHELGHAAGLIHSKTGIMRPTLEQDVRNIQHEDRRRIFATLYDGADREMINV